MQRIFHFTPAQAPVLFALASPRFDFSATRTPKFAEPSTLCFRSGRLLPYRGVCCAPASFARTLCSLEGECFGSRVRARSSRPQKQLLCIQERRNRDVLRPGSCAAIPLSLNSFSRRNSVDRFSFDRTFRIISERASLSNTSLTTPHLSNSMRRLGSVSATATMSLYLFTTSAIASSRFVSSKRLCS